MLLILLFLADSVLRLGSKAKSRFLTRCILQNRASYSDLLFVALMRISWCKSIHHGGGDRQYVFSITFIT